ncbi:hemolysin III family protein [Treponema sp. OttesenSCG-928-L16]|nr:hemolysin III family protein [Treponema sp. OttesenSCG-928-L16]
MRSQQQKKKLPSYPEPLPFQTPGEEIANSILHGLGLLLAIAGLVLLVLRANGYLGGKGGGALAIASYVIFAASMISMFLASTLYHAIQHEGAKRVFQILDHSCIYLLIAGTYTPFCLIALKGNWGWTLFGIEWGLAVLGIVFYSIGLKSLRKIEVAVYILMGWAIILGWFPLKDALPGHSLWLLIGGGAAYTLGTIWYRKKHRRGTHVAWHAFVLIGAACHWLAIWFLS